MTFIMIEERWMKKIYYFSSWLQTFLLISICYLKQQDTSFSVSAKRIDGGTSQLVKNGSIFQMDAVNKLDMSSFDVTFEFFVVSSVMTNFFISYRSKNLHITPNFIGILFYNFAGSLVLSLIDIVKRNKLDDFLASYNSTSSSSNNSFIISVIAIILCNISFAIFLFSYIRQAIIQYSNYNFFITKNHIHDD